MQEKIVHYCRKYKGHYLTEILDSKTILSRGSRIWVYWFVGKNLIIVQNITNVGFHGKPLIFFYFCDLVFINYFLKFLVVFTKTLAVRRSEGPAWAPGGFNFFFLHFMNTTKVSNFSANVFVNTTKNLKNNQWIPGHKNKKIWVVYHEIQHWWYFGQ